MYRFKINWVLKYIYSFVKLRMVSLQMKISSSESGRTFAATWRLDRTNPDSQRLSQSGRTVELCTTILCSVKVASHNVLTVYLAVDVCPDLWVRPGVISSAIRGDKVARPHVAASELPKSAASEMCRGCSRFWRKGTPQTAKPVSPVNPGSGWPWTNLFSSTFNLVNIICLLILLFVFFYWQSILICPRMHLLEIYLFCLVFLEWLRDWEILFNNKWRDWKNYALLNIILFVL